MPTLPIPQFDPPAEGHADSEPGVQSVTRPRPPSKRMARKPALRTPVFPRVQNERGMEYAMDHKGENTLSPNVPLPVRSSLAQTIAVYKVQLSKYLYLISGVTRYPGMAPGYPTAKTVTLINTAPGSMRRNSRPVPGLRGYPARSGYMNAPRRFSKALPLPVSDYSPPVYGE